MYPLVPAGPENMSIEVNHVSHEMLWEARAYATEKSVGRSLIHRPALHIPATSGLLFFVVVRAWK